MSVDIRDNPVTCGDNWSQLILGEDVGASRSL